MNQKIMKSLNKVIFYFASIIVLSGCQTTKDPFTLREDKKILETLNRTEDLANQDIDVMLNKARKSWLAGKKDIAQAFYIAAYKMQPKNIQLLDEMAGMYRQLNNYEMLTLCYKLILEQQPDNHLIGEKYGLLLIKQKKMQEAEQELKNVITTRQSWKSFNGLGIIADMREKHEQARVFFGKALKINPDNPEIINNLGYSLYMDDQIEKAQSYFLWAIKVNKHYKKARYNYALTLARQKKYPDSLVVFLKILEPSKANNNVGYLAMKNGDYEEAERFFHQAIKTSSKFNPKANANLQALFFLKNQP